MGHDHIFIVASVAKGKRFELQPVSSLPLVASDFHPLDEVSFLLAGGSNQSYLGAGYNIAENMILGRYQKYDQVKEPFVSSVLPGQNLQQQYEYLWGLSNPDEFKQKFDAAVNDLKSRGISVMG